MSASVSSNRVSFNLDEDKQRTSREENGGDMEFIAPVKIKAQVEMKK